MGLKPETILVICIFVLVVVQVASTYFYIRYAEENRLDIQKTGKYIRGVAEDLASYKLWNPENDDKLDINGVYFAEADYYCVRTKDRDYQDIRWTDIHENCHAFVDMDFNHFCNKANQTNWNIEEQLARSAN